MLDPRRLRRAVREPGERAADAVDDDTVTSHVKRIRKKFLAIDEAFDSIETVHGAGYRWRP